MKDGKLCQRRDAKFCPFHGPVIPRDEKGNPTEPEEIEKKDEEGGDIVLPLFGKATEVVKEGGRKKRKSEGGSRERIREKVVKGRISM